MRGNGREGQRPQFTGYLAQPPTSTSAPIVALDVERTISGERRGSDVAVHDLPIGRVGALCCGGWLNAHVLRVERHNEAATQTSSPVAKYLKNTIGVRIRPRSSSRTASSAR